MFRRLKPHQIVIDVSIAAACALLEAGVGGNGMPFSAVALAGMATALALRRLSPTLALGIAWLTALIQVGFLIGPDTSNLAILPVLYATASYGTPFVKWAGLVSSGVGAFVITAYLSVQTFVAYLPGDAGGTMAPAIPAIVVQFVVVFFAALAAFALSWTLGLLAKTWRTARESGQARLIAERQRIDAEQSVVVEQERGRIARDMHDVVAHSLAVVIAQADGARYAMESDPPAAAAALETISATAREALGDVRILLAQLRHSQSDSPQPVLADLDRLLDQLRASGLTIRFTQTGTPAALGTGQQLAVYRIVQESLTNALRHGNIGQEVTVDFGWRSREMEIEVSSALTTARPTVDSESGHGPGHGLAGMRERASLAGGRLTAEPRGDRFLVTAIIPFSGNGSEQ